LRGRTTAVLKDETDIITSIAENPIGRAKILVIIYVKTFITDVTDFIGNVIASDITLTDNFQYQSQFNDIDNII